MEILRRKKMITSNILVCFHPIPETIFFIVFARFHIFITMHPEIAKMERLAEEEWEEQMQMLSDFLKGRTGN